ncbi:MAG: nucleoside recognition domain-containing protein, partial [Pseudobdellovibrionaceae bacterium]
MSDLLTSKDVHLQKNELEKAFGAPVILFDGLLGGGLNEIHEHSLRLRRKVVEKQLEPWSEKLMTEKNSLVEDIAKRSIPISQKAQLQELYRTTRQIDQILLHPIFGLALFFVIMSLLFTSIFWLAAPFQDLVDTGFSKLAELITGYGGESLFVDFLSHGIVLSFAAVFVFVPQIFILFVGIGLLESSGYLARAATLIDKPFSKVGLTGRSFVPILSGFACAVPAIMATRNLSSKRDRVITNFIIPLMTCSARLPVYALLLGFLFMDQPSWKPGIALALLYFAALVIGGISAGILNRILAKTEQSHFMMELPLYRRPNPKALIQQCLTRTKFYVKRAGPIIFVLAVIIWFGSQFPNYKSENKFETSYLAQMGKVIEPVFTPMGVDWRV